MKKLVAHLIALFFRFVLWFRYRITIKGLEKLTPEALNKPGGVLFLPNHPAVFIDPTIITLALWPKFPIRPMVIEYMYFSPLAHRLLKFLDAIPVPNFEASSNSLKRKRHEKVLQLVEHDLKKGDNFLIYPAGSLKSSAKEEIGGSSAVYQVLQAAPETNVVLVRIKGLWGSIFSRAFTGKTPSLGSAISQGLKIAFKNLVFFSPRRDVIVEFEPAPADFPYGASKLELNRYLEDWYNRPDGLTEQKEERPGDSLVLVSHSIWSEKKPKPYSPPKQPDHEVFVEKIPVDLQEKIITKISELTELDTSAIHPEMNLSTDLGLDSLDIAELVTFLQTTFDVGRIPAHEMTTVKKVLGIAAKQVEVAEVAEEVAEAKTGKWFQPIPQFRAQIAHGETIPEVFLHNCERMGNAVACADLRSGTLTYSKMKIGVLLLADYIRKQPGDYIGVLLPASVGAFVTVLAIQMAGKIPLMINWTVGRRHLESVVALSNVEVVLSSWAFLDRLDQVDLDGIDDKLVMLESVRREFTLFDKIRAFLRSKRSARSILKSFGIDRLSKNSPAVLLFTSGTESMPKGVPLSHENILSNQRSAFQVIKILSDDVLFGILPPFHSFGFSVSGLMGLLSGVRTAYSPDPTAAAQLVKGFETWGITIMCGAPTFVKGLFTVGKPQQLKTMRLCVIGAEQAPPELFRLAEKMEKADVIVEGYGITECSPILTANLLGQPRRGVGKPIPGVELLVVDSDTLEPLPIQTRGLILARGPNVFSGYLNPGLKSPFVTVEEKEWYNTGDLGFLDEEGYLTLAGRLKRFVKIGPEMVSLPAIEEALLQAAEGKGWRLPEEGPGLAVIGIEEVGEKTRIVLFTTFSTTVEEVNTLLYEAGFSNIIKISEVFEVESVPVMGTGKIHYRLLEEKYQST